MDICSYQHEEIVYEGRICPLCDLADNITEVEADILDLQERIDAAEYKLDELNGILKTIDSSA